MHCKYFKNHLQPFWNAFQNAKICWEALAKGETLNYSDIAFHIYCCNDVFLIKNDQQFNINIAKSKLILLKNARNLAGAKLDIF